VTDYPYAVFEVYVNGENLYQAHGDDDLGCILSHIGSDTGPYWETADPEDNRRFITIEIEAHE